MQVYSLETSYCYKVGTRQNKLKNMSGLGELNSSQHTIFESFTNKCAAQTILYKEEE